MACFVAASGSRALAARERELAQCSQRVRRGEVRMVGEGHAVNRRDFAALVAGGLLLGMPELARAAGGKSAEKQLMESLINLAQSQRSLLKAKGYLVDANWDKARTYVVYCTRNLRLRSSLKRAAELIPNQDQFVEAIEIVADLDNILTQLDASIYTAIFIRTFCLMFCVCVCVCVSTSSWASKRLKQRLKKTN